jgi:hypothetical protein
MAIKATHVEPAPAVLADAVSVALSARSSDRLADELRRKNLAIGVWTLRGLADLLSICRRADLDDLVASAARLPRIGECAASAVWDASAKLGFAHRDAVRLNLDERLGSAVLRGLSDADLDAALGSSEGVMSLPYGYVFAAPHRDPTVVKSTYRMLQVAQPLSIREVRAGLRRRCKFRKVPFKVPLAVLREFFNLSSDFDIDDRDNVRMCTSKARTEDTLQWWIVDELRASDYGMLTRNQVMQRARRARKNITSVSIYLTYGEQIAHDGRGFFYPIGCPPEESLVADALEVAGATVHRTTQSWYYDHQRDIVTVLVDLGDSVLSSGVVFADPPSRPYLNLLGDSHFALLDEQGDSYGNVQRSEPTNAIIGLTTFFAHTYPEPGDVLKLEIHLKSMIARAEIGGSELEDT